MQNVIGNAHFSNVMQERAAFDQEHPLLAQPHFARQIQCHFGDALGVPLRLPVAHVERA